MEIIEESVEYGYKLVRLPSGEECAVATSVNGYSSLSKPVICLPADTTARLALAILETYGDELRSLAQFVGAESEAYGLYNSSGLGTNYPSFTLEEIESSIARMLPFSDRSELIVQVIEYLTRAKRRAIARETSRAKRIGVKSNYDKLFVSIGRRDGFNCSHCGVSSADLQIDHITPLAENGSNDLVNLQLLCPQCNRAKSDSLPNSGAV